MHAFNLNLLMARSALRDGKPGFAIDYTRHALACANRMRDRKRAGLCLKILHWLRVDLRRVSPV